MADETGSKGLFDHVLDLFVYAPVGLMAESRDWIPRLADRGREQLGTQLRVARLLGQVAVQRGQQEAGKFLHRRGTNGNRTEPAEPAPSAGRPPATVAAQPVAPAAATATGAAVTEATLEALADIPPGVADDEPPAEVTVVPEALATDEPDATEMVAEVIPVDYLDEDAVTEGSVGADELAIPAYDSLAASQVVQRLEGLTPAELEAVRRYEVAHRGRKTILGKVAQLQQR